MITNSQLAFLSRGIDTVLNGRKASNDTPIAFALITIDLEDLDFKLIGNVTDRGTVVKIVLDLVEQLAEEGSDNDNRL